MFERVSTMNSTGIIWLTEGIWPILKGPLGWGMSSGTTMTSRVCWPGLRSDDSLGRTILFFSSTPGWRGTRWLWLVHPGLHHSRPLQRHMLQQFGGRGVCCDSTHGTNAYNFTLTTLLVIDEFGQGFPVGWCLSNHEDFSPMCIFFRELQRSSGSIASGFFMSDMARQFYNAWCGIMGSPRPKKLVCTWNVDKAWREELRRKVENPAAEAEIYKMLRTVLEQTDESLFQDCLSGLLDQLSQDARGQAFRTYFVKDPSQSTRPGRTSAQCRKA